MWSSSGFIGPTYLSSLCGRRKLPRLDQKLADGGDAVSPVRKDTHQPLRLIPPRLLRESILEQRILKTLPPYKRELQGQNITLDHPGVVSGHLGIVLAGLVGVMVVHEGLAKVVQEAAQ